MLRKANTAKIIFDVFERWRICGRSWMKLGLGDWGRGTREQRRGNLNGFHHLAGLDNKVIITIVATATIQYPWVELAPWCANRISLSPIGRRQGGGGRGAVNMNLCHHQLFRTRKKCLSLSKINVDYPINSAFFGLKIFKWMCSRNHCESATLLISTISFIILVG